MTLDNERCAALQEAVLVMIVGTACAAAILLWVSL